MRRNKAAQAGIVLIAGTLALAGCDIGGGKKDGGKAGATVAPSTAAPSATATTAAPTPTTAESPDVPPQGDNGVAAKPPQQIIGSARDALSTANSVRVSGNISDGSGQITINMRLGQDKASGTISAPAKTGRIVTIELRSVDGRYYARAGRDFWASQVNESAAAALANRWVIAPPNALGSGRNFGGVRQFSTLLSSQKVPTRVIGPATINGVPAVGVDGGDGRAYVATTGKPYPLRLAAPQGGTSGQLDFTEYDAPFTVSAPPEAVDFSKVRPA